MKNKPIEKIKTLVVDDSARFRETIQIFLHDQSEIMLVGSVSSGAECLNLLDKNPADLVIMDARMSGLDGPETTRKLKEKYHHVKVIICTVWAEEEACKYALQSGADDYFVKGEPLSDLMSKIHALFS